MVQMNLLPEKNKDADIENGHMDTGDGEGRDGMNEEPHWHIHTYISSGLKLQLCGSRLITQQIEKLRLRMVNWFKFK